MGVIQDPNGRIVGAGGTEPAGGGSPRWWRCAGPADWLPATIVVVTMEPRITARLASERPSTEARWDGLRRRRPERIGVARAGCQQRAYRCGPGCWLNRWRPTAAGVAPQATHRSAVTWKHATSIDGRSAAADGSSQ